MIEATLIKYLGDNLNISATAEIPKSPPDEFVVVERVGGGSTDLISRASFAIQSYSTSLVGAAALSEAVNDAMMDFTDEDNISSVKTNTISNFTDTSAKKYRYQGIYEITYMED